MTRPKGYSTSSTPGESELAGRQEPRRPRPASASDELSARSRGAAGGDEEPEFGEVVTDALLDAKEEAKARRRKKPGPTREGEPSDGTEAGGIPDLLTEPTESTEPVEPTRTTDGPGA
ncbi:MAG: hypothetical protein ABIW49_10455 [Knoellia sp.]